MAQQINFSQFGGAFVDTVFSEQVIYNAIGPGLEKASMPPIDKPAGPAHVTGTARLDLHSLGVRRNDQASQADRFVAYDVLFNIHLTLYVKLPVGQENYEVTARAWLRFQAETWSQPLGLYVRVLTVPASAIKVDAQGAGNWFNLAKQFGNLEAQVGQAVADGLNPALAATNEARSIIVEKMVREAQPPPFTPRQSLAANSTAPSIEDLIASWDSPTYDGADLQPIDAGPDWH